MLARVLRLFLLAALAAGLVLTLRSPARPVYALPNPTFCYTVSDVSDLLIQVERDGSSETLIGGVGVPFVEAIAFQPGTDTLYAANSGSLGTLNLGTGAYTLVGPFGSGDGALGNVAFNDVDSLAIDPLTGIMYGTQRDVVPGGSPDVLIQIDPTTGAHVPDAFGPGVDYVVIPAIVVGGNTLADIDGIAIDPWDGQMFGVANDSGFNDALVEIDKFTGAISLVGSFGIDDVEGLGFFNADQFLYATTGQDGPAATNNRLWQVNKGTAATTELRLFTTPGSGDFESVDCLVADANTITGTVFLDTNENGGLYEPGTDVPEPGVTVRLYRDINGNGQVDGGDILIQTQDTDAAGFYSFTVGAAGPFVLDIDRGDLPANNVLTTDNLEEANFENTGLPFSEFGQTDPDNDFGYRLGGGGGGGGGGAQATPTPTPTPVPEVEPTSPPGPEPPSFPAPAPTATPIVIVPGLPKTGAPPSALGLVRIVVGVLLALEMIAGGAALHRRLTD